MLVDMTLTEFILYFLKVSEFAPLHSRLIIIIMIFIIIIIILKRCLSSPHYTAAYTQSLTEEDSARLKRPGCYDKLYIFKIMIGLLSILLVSISGMAQLWPGCYYCYDYGRLTLPKRKKNSKWPLTFGKSCCNFF